MAATKLPGLSHEELARIATQATEHLTRLRAGAVERVGEANAAVLYDAAADAFHRLLAAAGAERAYRTEGR